VHVDRHAAPVVFDLEGAVLEYRDPDVLAVPCESLIDAVVDDLVREVIRTRRVGLHAGAATHRIQAAQYLDIRRRIRRCHQTPLGKAAESTTHSPLRVSAGSRAAIALSFDSWESPTLKI